MRLFIRERRALARVAPHLVRPLPFVVPTYAASAAQRAGDAHGAGDQRHRSRATATKAWPIPACTCPPAQIVSREEACGSIPVVAPEGVTGGAVWHDYQMHSTDRMTLSFVLSAVEPARRPPTTSRPTGFLRETAASPACGSRIG